MRLLHEFLENYSLPLVKNNLADFNRLGLNKIHENSDKDAFDVNIEIRTMDQLGKIHEVSVPKSTHMMKKCSYIKMVNVPSSLDVSGV